MVSDMYGCVGLRSLLGIHVLSDACSSFVTLVREDCASNPQTEYGILRTSPKNPHVASGSPSFALSYMGTLRVIGGSVLLLIIFTRVVTAQWSCRVSERSTSSIRLAPCTPGNTSHGQAT